MDPTGVGGRFLAVLFLLLLTFTAHSNADTVIDTSPTSDLTLRLTDQPFHVNDSIIVPPGVTLTVEPGVTVKFSPAVGLRVEGRLLAVGQPEKRIRFTAAETPNVENRDEQPPIWFDGARLAGDFTESHIGRLELLFQGSFGTVCQNGWDRYSYYDDHYNNRVAARMLGYETCSTVYNRGNGNGSILLNNVRCNGRENSLWDCRHAGIRVHNCGHSQDVWLQCSGYSGYRGIANETAKYWSGIELVNNSSVPGVSDLQYVDVEFAGLPNIGTHSNDTAAISVSGIPPVLDNLNITNVIGNGVLLRDITGHAAINNSYIEDSMGNGVSFRSFDGDLALQNFQISNVSKAGVYYNRTLPLPSYKMCLTPETTAPDGEPLIVSFDSTDLHLGLKTSCTQVFRNQNPGHILAVRILYIRRSRSVSGHILDIYDGSSTSSPRLQTVQLYGDEVYMPSPLYTTGGSVLLSFSMLNVNSWERYQGMFSIQSVTTHLHHVGLSMKSVDVTTSTYGIFLENQIQPVHITELRVADSSDTGLYVGKGSGAIVLQDGAFTNNGDHVYFEHTQRNITVHNNELNGSPNYALSSDATSSVYTLSNNIRFIFQSNKLVNNKYGISVLYARDCLLTDIMISGNAFENHSETALSLGDSCGSGTVQVIGNSVSKTNGTAAFSINCGTKILNNTLFDNVVSQCVLCVSASPLFMTGNTFRNNEVRTENKRHQVGATLVIKGFPYSFTVTSNIFENPSVEYQLAIWHENSFLRTLDVSRNYWGTSNPDGVYSGLLDNTKRYTLRTEFLYTPFYITPDLSSLSSVTIEVDPAPTSHTLGGRIKTDLTLKDTSRPYTVIHDLNLTASATLTIEPGVVLEFDDSVGMYIEGRLNVSGTENEKCIFTGKGKSALTKNITSKRGFGKFTLLRGPAQSYTATLFYGRLYGEENGNILPVCYDSSFRGPMLTNWLDGECRRLGYKSLRYMDLVTDTARLGFKLKCAERETDFENKCSAGMQRYRCTSFFRVVCTKYSRESTWAGIRLGLMARPSSIQNAVIQFAGFFDSGSSRTGPSLQVDFNRHIIDNVTILTSGGGIQQIYVDGLERNMTNIVIADIDTSAFETYTLSATLTDSRMEDIRSYAVLFQSGSPSWTMTGYFTPYKCDCGSSYLASEGDLVPFYKYIHTKCGTFTTRPDLKIRVFFIYDYDFELLLTDTMKNWTVGLNSTDSVFTTSTNTLQFLKAWRNSCTRCSVYVHAIIMAVKDELPQYRPSLTLDNVLVSGSRTAVSGQYRGHTNGIRTDIRHPDYPYVGQVGIDIKNSVLVGNNKLMNVQLNKVSSDPLGNELLPSFAISVKDTNLDSNDYGIYIHNDRGSRERLIIDGCQISGTRNTLLQYSVREDNSKGVNIKFLNNEITDNIGIVLDISGGALHMTVSGNKIMDNEYRYGPMVRYRGYEKIINILSNDISGNRFRNIVEMNMEQSDYDLRNATKVVLAANTITNNTYSSSNNRRQSSQPPVSATLLLGGYGNVCVQNNSLQNPGLEVEVYANIRSTKWTDTIEAKYNFWECDNTTCVRGRVYDAHNDMYLPEVRVFPFVSRSNEMVYTPDVTEGLPQGNVLGGWLNQSITLAVSGSPFYLKEDWTILPGVEVFIEPGVFIKPAGGKGILVLGRIVARGGKKKSITFGCQHQKAHCFRWKGLVLASDDENTSPSQLLFVDIFNAGYKGNMYSAAVQAFTPSLIIQNSRVIQSSLNGIELIGPAVKTTIIKRNEFLNNGGVGINVAVANPRGVPLNTKAMQESVGWPNDIYGIDNICEGSHKMLIVNESTLVYHSHGRRSTGNTLNCTRAIRSELGQNITVQVLQYNLAHFRLELFEGFSPLRSRRILYADQYNGSLPSDFPVNSSGVTIRVYSRDWNRYKHGPQSMVFGIKISSAKSKTGGSHGNLDIEENIFLNNGLGGVNITTFGQSNLDIGISKNIFRGNGFSTSYLYEYQAEHSKAAIRLNVADTNATLTNNYIEGNHGGIHARTHSVFQNNKLNIRNNQILFTTQQESIQVIEVENGPYIQQCSIDGNVIQHGQGDRYSDVIHLEGVSGTVTKNYIYNNTCLHVISWTTPANRNISDVTTDNVIYYNIAKDANNMAAIVAGGSSPYLHDNYFYNPTFKFELTSQGASAEVNASSNWWGTREATGVKQRIRDADTGFSYPKVYINPITDSPSAYQGDSCPLGWMQNNRTCYLYVGGAQNLTQARASCEVYYGMLVNPITQGDQAFVISILRSRAIGERSFGIWTETWDKEDGKCPMFNLTTVGGKANIFKEDCSRLSPYLCIRSSVNECPNGCTYNGRCGKDKRCHCNRGWEGKDCSVYHCRDRNKCGQYGACVGPNQCKCQPGWQGRACSVSYCPVYSSCRSCTEQPGCGWCDHKQRCLPGHESQPWREQCGTWFYHDCFSVDTHMGCSSQIEYIGCDYRQCNSTIRYSNDELCHRCRDVEACFSDDLSYWCREWDMGKCPNGLVRPNYNLGNRALDTTLHAHVKVINPGSTALYVCPISNSEARGHTILVTRDKVNYPRHRYFVIVSKQAGGILHKVYSTKETGTYQYFGAVRASLEDVIQYANFNQSVPIHSVMDDRTLEHVPEGINLKTALKSTDISNSHVHVIKDDSVFKCLGHWYNVTKRPVASQYIVLPKITSKNIGVGDVVAGTKSQGFLEDIEDVVADSDAVTYHAKMKTCSETMSFDSITAAPVSTFNTMYCHGGEQNDRSLHISESVRQQTATPVKGDVIPGRTSGAFLGQVVSRFDKGEYVFMECIQVQDITKDKVLTSAHYTAFHPDRRLNNEICTDGIFTSLRKKAVFGSPSILQKQLTVDMDIWVKAGLELHLQSTVPKAQKIGVRLDATFDYNINSSYEAFIKSPEITEDHYLVPKRTSLGAYCLAISQDMCLPLNIALLSMKYSFTAATQGTGILRTHSGGRVRQTLGATWRYGAGGEQFPRAAVTDVSHDLQHADAMGNVNIKVTIEPALHVQFPAISDTVVYSLVSPALSLRFLKKLIDPTVSSRSETITYTTTAPLTDSLDITTCSNACAGREGEHLVVHRAGPGSRKDAGWLRLKLSWALFSSLEESVFVPGSVQAIAYCKPALSSAPCHLDADRCTCPNGNSSVKHDNSCQCDICPDGKTKKVVTKDPSQPACPCYCADGWPREMGSDGKCWCGCECPNGEDGTIKPDGGCHCPCKCNNCQDSLISSDGKCECPNDICPVCDSAYEPVWEDCHCVCREKTQCGLYPACVRGRRGEQCDQPDCEPCSLQTDDGLQECFGNGVCTPDNYFCRSRCVCTRFWTGVCCNVRIPRNMGGDPHLQTADGISYDYHGIGEFWDCKSRANDFGVQVGFFGFKQASLVGAAAVKVGHSVATITTPANATETTLPTLRIDGQVQSINQNNTRLTLNNGTVIVDIAKIRNNATGAVMMIAIQYDTGVSVTVDVRFSPVMGRLFLNVRSGLTASFKGQTSGLCGLMDDNQDNDFTMANGTVVTKDKAVGFAESWRISESFSGSGLYGSWSWDSSNFHADDVMDPSYTDPSLYNPSYAPVNVSQAEMKAAKTACQGKGLEGVLLQECLYDIVVTKDITFSNQEAYQSGCPGQCNGKGRCINSTCECNTGWTGSDCSIGSCGVCVNGECDSGFCVCEVGWEGVACDQKATCFYVNNCTDEDHGVCYKTNRCRCEQGFVGNDCSIAATCSNVSECSGHGVCVDFDVCKCDSGWAGPSCTEFSCESLAMCSGHGRCEGYDVCKCDDGWQGNSCSLPDCSSNNDCSLHGICTAPGTCTCYDGYHGENCTTVNNCTALSGCNGNGICISTGENGTETKCTCFEGFSGDTCNNVTCSAVNDCSGHGKCLEPNLCQCDKGYGGNDCSNFSCEVLGYCSGNGECVSLDTCSCSPGWLGERCDEPVCSAVANCSGNGDCVSPSQCECLDEYDGVDCSTRIGPNNYTPLFAYDWYNATVPEDALIGTVIVFQDNITMINATDLDIGRNGRLEYAFSGSNGAERFFSMDSKGQLSVIGKLDYESLPQKDFIMTVVATDKGVPPKSAATKVAVIVQDVNDNAPVFQLFGFPDIPVNASRPLGRSVGQFLATDKDSGSYGRVRHSIINESNPDAAFDINEDTGELKVVRYPTQPRYDITVMAEDGGEPPRPAILPVVINVYGQHENAVVDPTTDTAPTVSGSPGSTSTPGTPAKSTTYSKGSTPKMTTTQDSTTETQPPVSASPKRTSITRNPDNMTSREARPKTTTQDPTTETQAPASASSERTSTTRNPDNMTSREARPTITTQATVIRSFTEPWSDGFKICAGALGGVLVLCFIAFIAVRCVRRDKR